MDKYLISSKNNSIKSNTQKRKSEDDDGDPKDLGFNQNIMETSEEEKLSPQNLQKSYLFNGQFFTIIQCDGLKLTAQCKNCSKVIQGQKMSTGNFLSHLKVIISIIINKFRYRFNN